MEASEQMPPDQAPVLKNLGPTGSDIIFLIFIFCVILAVGGVGRMIYNEGKKTEVAKHNVEVWAKWLTEAGPLRAKPGFLPAACAYTPATIDASGERIAPAVVANAKSPHWGGCYKELIAPEGPLGGLRNPFTGEVPLLTVKCDAADKTLGGRLVMEKLVPAPVGSAVPVVVSQLVETDLIDQKMQLRMSACDGGSYPTKPIEFEF